jgi:hypothetical protein
MFRSGVNLLMSLTAQCNAIRGCSFAPAVCVCACAVREGRFPLRLMKVPATGEANDLVLLKATNESEIVSTLERRFRNDDIYT